MNNDKAGNGTGAVYFMTNATDGANEVIMHQRMMDGRLGMAMAYATGGSGAGMGPMAPFADPLGSQSAIVMSDKHKMLFAVNAGSNDVSAFHAQESKLMLMKKVSSGGNFPVSLAVHGDWLYVLNAGGDGTLMGYTIQGDGALTPMMNAMRSLSYGGKTPPYVFEAPGQIDFSPDGKKLIVIEKGINAADHSTNKIHVYKVDGMGMVSENATVSVSYGHFPFASTFTSRGQLLYAYITNFASGVITGYRVAEDGCLTRLNENGVTIHTGKDSYPTDLIATPDGRFLYALLPGLKQVAAYQVNMDGSLVSLGVAHGDWPIHIQGIVAR